jgi:hypothetical protein
VRYAGARIWTLSEGEVGELHIGLRGTMAAMVRKDTADKVKRGLTGRALAGMNPGGMAYGYRKVPKLDERGEPVRGLREIDEDQAAVIVRIFEEFANGRSAATIMRRSTPRAFPPVRRRLAHVDHPRRPQAPQRHPPQRPLPRAADLQPHAQGRASGQPQARDPGQPAKASG